MARPDAVGADKDGDAADRPANAGTIKVIEGFRRTGCRARRALSTRSGSPRPGHLSLLRLATGFRLST